MLIRIKRMLQVNKKANNYFLLIFCILLSFISLGYSSLQQNLMITGEVSYASNDHKLYTVLKRAARNGTYAREYVGNHQDSITEQGTEAIYHWYASNDLNGTTIQNLNNVIFAGQCWKMIRTTDTGGVKLLYNGEAENNQCLNTRGNHIGYTGESLETLNSYYYYGTTFIYDSVNQVFQLAGNIEQTTYNVITGPSLIGKYTCKSGTIDDTCATLYLLESVYDDTQGHVLSLNGTSHYSQYGQLKFNTDSSSPAYTGYMYNKVYTTKEKILDTIVYKYSSGFTYQEGTYTLDNNSVTFSGDSNSDIESLSTHHYTCWNTTGTCNTISYIYSYSDGFAYYIDMTNGNNISDSIDEMLFANDVNQKNSLIKTGIDFWYERYLKNYDIYLEDTVFCNDRAISSLGGWNPTNGEITDLSINYLKFQGYNISTNLNCSHITDQFSVSNTSALLNYKIGLLSNPEINLLNNSTAQITGQYYWLSSPSVFSNDSAEMRVISSTLGIESGQVSNFYGVRPVISLKNEIEYSSGDGSMSNPYIITEIPINDTLIQHGSTQTITFGKNINRDVFESITTVNHINIPATAIDSWDASSLQNGCILAWYLDEDNDNKYELYLGQEGGVKTNLDASFTFSNFTNIDSIDLTNLDISNTKKMKSMFWNTGYNSTSFTLDLGDNFDTSNLIDMNNMFNSTGYSSNSFTLDLGDNFDTSNVEDMWQMFFATGRSSTIFTLNLGDNFDTSKVTNMFQMFALTGRSSTVFILDLADKFNTSNVINMFGMFSETGYSSTVFTLDLGDYFDTSNVTTMERMFYSTGYSSTTFTLDLGDYFDTSKVTNMRYIFYQVGYNNTSFTLDLGTNFNTSKVTDMHGMFRNTGYFSTSFTLNLRNDFDTSNVEDMEGMFYNTGYSSTIFTLNLGNKFDTSKVINMYNMFWKVGYSNTSFTMNLGSKFDTSNVINMGRMFYNAGYNSSSFTLALGEKFYTTKVTNMDNMFSSIGFANTKLVLDLHTFDFTSVTSYNNIFSGIRTTSKVYVKDSTARTWVIARHNNLTTSNVLIKT